MKTAAFVSELEEILKLPKGTLRMENFDTILSIIYHKSALQKKRLRKYLEKQDHAFFEEAEQFAARYLGYLSAHGITAEEAVNAYLQLCRGMITSQVEFMKTGRYPVKLSSTAYESVYSNPKRMTAHMIGLALSQYLWETHYSIFKFFGHAIQNRRERIRSYLEIGPGHGLFLDKAISCFSGSVKLSVVDISLTSIQITKSIVEYFRPDAQVHYHQGDMLQLDLGEQFDFVTMGEVIEHVNLPCELLKKFRELLAPGGSGFISTCVNCPSIDHVYHFKDVSAVRDMFEECGLATEQEAVLPVEDLPMPEIVKKKITINYCAVVRRQ